MSANLRKRQKNTHAQRLKHHEQQHESIFNSNTRAGTKVWAPAVDASSQYSGRTQSSGRRTSWRDVGSSSKTLAMIGGTAAMAAFSARLRKKAFKRKALGSDARSRVGFAQSGLPTRNSCCCCDVCAAEEAPEIN